MSTNVVPYQILSAPVAVWVAAVGSTFPDVSATPSGAWSLLGTAGDRGVSEEGVKITHSQTQEDVYSNGETGILKSFVTREGLTIAFTLLDFTAEAYAKMMDNAVTVVAAGSGTAGIKHVPLYRGVGDAPTTALLIKAGASAYGDGFSTQLEIPMANQASAPDVTFVKGKPVSCSFMYKAIVDPSAASAGLRFGRIVMQTAAAS